MELTPEATSRMVQAGDVRIHIHEAGDGPCLLLIHGGAPGAYGWGNFGQNLPALSRRFRTVIVDLPGYGRSDKPEIEGDRIAYYADVFGKLLDELGVARCSIVGLATGGATAMVMALNRPELVHRLVLVNSAGGLPIFQPTPSEGQKLILNYYEGAGPSVERMKNYLEMIIYDKSKITPELIEDRFRASVDPEFMATAPEGGHGKSFIGPVWHRLHEIQAKTLIVWGRDNRVLGYDNALFMLSRLRDSQLHIYAQAGLWVPWEKCDEFNTLITGFVLQ